MALLSIAVKIKQVGAEGEDGAIEVDCYGRGRGQNALSTAGGPVLGGSKERRRDQKPGRRTTVVIPRGPGFSLVKTLW